MFRLSRNERSHWSGNGVHVEPESVFMIGRNMQLQANMAIDAIRAPLMLTDDEMAQVNNWLNKHPDLIGAV
ncbi:hypothetical protein [Aeromonas australiensis]|uniref:hypothetical protein n=1 Tax=Aeromonas australiensis TaxID=1114880 RepID=UPI001F37CD08|nr:hypothetical protein [Aeromonas australiensis]